RALRALDQKSNRPAKEIQNRSHANSPAFPALINNRCAPVITKTHHPSSLTEEEMTVTMRDRPINTPWRPLALLASWRSAFPPAHDSAPHRDNSRKFPISYKRTKTPT